MPTESTAYLTEIEKQTAYYVKKLAKIDRILRRPVETLIEQALESGGNEGEPSRFPGWVSERPEPPKDYSAHSPPTQAVCFATLQRLWRVRRRFNWLERNDDLRVVKNHFPDWFGPIPGSDFKTVFNLFESRVFGNLNPLAASYIFRVLVESGEAHAHSGFGFLAIFAMLWSLYRRFPDALTAGARIEPSEPTAYVTANCILCLTTVERVTKMRAELLQAVGRHLESLKDHLRTGDDRSCWLFNLELDELSADLRRLSPITIAQQSFMELANEVARRSEELGRDAAKSLQDVYDNVVVHGIGKSLGELGKLTEPKVAEAQVVIDGLETDLLRFLEGRADLKAADLQARSPEYLLSDGNKLDLRFGREYCYDPRYWRDLFDAARKAIDLCKTLFGVLEEACISCAKLSGNSSEKQIQGGLESLVKSNENVIQLMRTESPLPEAADWCRMVMERQIAYASAGHFTDFDAGELVSGIAVAVRWNLMKTSLQVSDAVSKAIRGARRDGGWSQGLPFFSPDNALGIWPGTSEIVALLSGTIQAYPDVTVADRTLFRFLDWLERTRITLRIKDREVVGWPSDRLRHYQKVHFATTAFSINALLEIRDLVEYRLWQVCQKRFAAVPGVETLDFKDIEPVDLGARHPHRLHRLLSRIISDSGDGQGTRSPQSVYSLILHGPPGSSKTRVAEGLAARIWKESGRGIDRQGRDNPPRYIRVTPADFTRMGEDRIDSEARLIFDLLAHVRGVTIVFDEIDDILRRRSTQRDHRPNFMELVVPAMLNRLADLRAACPHQDIVFILATNYIDNIEPALIRPGRVDRPLSVVYPDRSSRLAMICRHAQLSHKGGHFRLRDALYGARIPIAQATKGWPWMTIEKLLRDVRGRFRTDLGAGDDRRFEALLRELIESNRNGFAPPQYGPRFRNDDGCPELFDEAAHFLICQDVLTEPGTLIADMLKDLPEALRKKVQAVLNAKLLMIAAREGREIDPADRLEFS
jgi:hypothetical protein